MSVIENLISEKNQYELFYNILLSVKSKNPTVKITEDSSKGKFRIESDSISIFKTDNVKTELSSFSIKIERIQVPRLFFKNSYKYIVNLHGDTRTYKSFRTLTFKPELMSERCKKVIEQVFDYLINIDEQMKIEETNQILQDIISDISTTVDKSYKRDNKIDEVLNNN